MQGRSANFPTGFSRSGLLLFSVSLLLLVSTVAAASLQDGDLDSQTVGPGDDRLLAFNFSYQGDTVLNGPDLSYNDSVNFSQDTDWTIASFDNGDGDWISSQDFLGNDTDNDGVYTSASDLVVNGNLSRYGTGDSLTIENPWGNVTFIDAAGDGDFENSTDSIVHDFDGDRRFTVVKDVKLNGTSSLSEGDFLEASKPDNWSKVGFYDHSSGGRWDPGNDTIVLENSTTGSFAGEFNFYNDTGDAVIAGNTSIFNGTNLSATKPVDWGNISFHNGTEFRWDEKDDAIVNDTGGRATFSIKPDNVINGSKPVNGDRLTIENPFNASPELAFKDAGTKGDWEPGSDLIVEDFGNLTVSLDNDTKVAGSPPGNETPYSYNDSFHPNWTLASVDNDNTDGGYNSTEDSIVLDDDNNSVFGHTANAVTLVNSGTASASEIQEVEVWAEDGTTGGFQPGEDIRLDNVSRESGSWVAKNFSRDIVPDDQFYVTANISVDPINMPTVKFKIPSLSDDGNGSYDSGDEGFFVEGPSDTGGLTSATSHTIYTANITGVENNDTDGDSKANQFIVQFSERVDVTDGGINDTVPGLNLTGIDANVSDGFYNQTNVSEITLDLTSEVGGSTFPSIVYSASSGEITTNSSTPAVFEISETVDNLDNTDTINNAPTADISAPGSVDESTDNVDVDGDGSSDPEGDSLSYTWSLTENPNDVATLTDTGSVAPDLDVGSVDSDTVIEVELKVDDGSKTHSTTQEITVSEVATTQDGGGDGGGGGTGGNTSDTATGNVKDLRKDIVIGAGNIEKVEFAQAVLDSISVAATTDIIGSVNYSELDKPPSNVGNAPGSVYKYLELEEKDVSDSDIRNVTFSFTVSKSWVTDSNIDPGTIRLERYVDGSWTNLSTTKVDGDSDKIYLEAVSPGMSVYAVSGSQKVAEFNVKSVTVSSSQVSTGEEVNITVKVENMGNAEGDYELSVQAGGQTLSRTLKGVKPGETREAVLTASFDSSGSKKIEVGGRSASVQVEEKAVPGMDVNPLFVAVFVLLIAGVGGGVLFYTEMEEEADEVIEGIEEALEHPVETVENLVDDVKTKLESVGGDEAEDFEWEGFEDH